MMTIPRLTIIYAYYENPKMFERQLGNWMTYPKLLRDRIEFIVVDDGSPRNPAQAVIDANGGFPLLDLRVYRVLVDIPWNQDGARNLAMSECRTLWAFMTDMDHLLPPDQASLMLRYPAQHGHYYMPDQQLTNGESLQRPHPNSYLMSRADFWMMGGYDEDFAGYYGSDYNFRRCAVVSGLIEKYEPKIHTVVYRTQDEFDANTKDYSRKEGPLAAKNNPTLLRKMQGPPYRAENPIRFPYERVL